MESHLAKAAGFLSAFRGGLNVQSVPSSRLIQVSYTHPDLRLAADVVNMLVKIFIEDR
jgi:uncharacterized protein involved in exopolysaccharide biosynthesis